MVHFIVSVSLDIDWILKPTILVLVCLLIFVTVIFCNLYTDIDECIEGTSGCDQICNNTVGSYNCSCMTGYQLSSDDHNCNDVNECTINNGGCEQICINTNGGHYCMCQEGYSFNNSDTNCTG